MLSRTTTATIILARRRVPKNVDATGYHSTHVMEDQKIYGLLSRLVVNYVPRGDTEHLTQQCWDILVEKEAEAEFQDFSDLDHITTVLLENLDSEQGAKLSNLVNRLVELQDHGVIRRPAEILHFLKIINEPEEYEAYQDDAGVSDQMKYMGLHRIPDSIQEEEFLQRESKQEFHGAGDILRQLHSQQTPSDRALLQDLPYALQGLKTESFTWHEKDELRLDLPQRIPFPLMGLLNQLLEPALLYKKLVVLTSEKHQSLVKQSLNSGVHEELQSYLTLVGVVENQVRRQEASGTQKVTLRRCVVLLQEATLGLRLLYDIMNESKGLVGGQILSLLHAYSYNGDQFVAKFATKILKRLSKPFYEILNEWVAGGNLVDPHDEFFVKIGDHNAAWEGRYALDESRIPSYMTESIAKKVLEIGKTLYFLRSACDDAAWVDLRRTTNRVVSNYEELETQIEQGYIEVVRRVNTVLQESLFLDEHLKGLKDYLMISKGDFVQVLIESVAPLLDKPANRLLRHHLTSTLETAIRGSSAQFDHAEVLKSVDARMLELGHGDIGWDVFTLDYRVEAPLDVVILNRRAMTEYLRVFNFLWRIKRVSYSLSIGWRRLATGERRTRLSNGREASWHEVRLVYQEMLHFIGEMQYYINYEVVEMAWTDLHRKLKSGKALTVDEIVAAHETYLGQITHKGLLGGGATLMGDLHDVLKTMLLFRDSIDGLYDTAVRLEQATLADDNNDAVVASLEERFNAVCTRISELKGKFEKSVTRLVRELSKQDDSEMRFLGVRLDFNGFYTARRQQMIQQQQISSQKD